MNPQALNKISFSEMIEAIIGFGDVGVGVVATVTQKFVVDVNGVRLDPVHIDEVKRRVASRVSGRRQNKKRELERKRKNRLVSCQRLTEEKERIENRLQQIL